MAKRPITKEDMLAEAKLLLEALENLPEEDIDSGGILYGVMRGANYALRAKKSK